MTIGENIRRYRKEQGLSEEEFAIKLRTGIATVHKLEQNELHPDTNMVLKISTVLDVPASDFMETGSEESDLGIDEEIRSLVETIGLRRAKLILRQAKDFTEEDYLHVMKMLYEIKYKN
ncbi:DNA-binding protein [Pontibacillus halophilus JSM 076056 = DSM 19796]|uniref:DNA-binding protein n=1 Tax=Pontibacillus halophilus JSM 076056 = DSM 19796 TaxID=1385510 RepID=A0A0A5G8Y0_9BACI|nr:helix-turn-helix transcriptional regulator [Pontibacillus halophilus]KGX89601.1 DNA-binding protein [Pontibacillus halophilus JSM 076056 = DSM 19796]